MVLTTLGHADALGHLCSYMSGACYRWCAGNPCRVLHSSSRSISFRSTPKSCCCSSFPLPRTTLSASTSTMSTAITSQMLSRLLLIWFALTVVQLPFFVSATSPSDDSVLRNPHDKLQNGSRQNDLFSLAKNPQHVIAPYYGRGRKMLFGTLSCAPQDLSLTQGPVSSTSGIPTFDVQIVNLCGVCAMGQIHVACGNWASATPVDPFVFTRLAYNDCLVNNGAPLSSQGSVSFQYSNSAMYPMSITTATNECQR